MNKDEQLARKMYDVYCLVMNLTDQLDSDALFSDSNNQKQINAWIAAADCAINILSVDEDGELE